MLPPYRISTYWLIVFGVLRSFDRIVVVFYLLWPATLSRYGTFLVSSALTTFLFINSSSVTGRLLFYPLPISAKSRSCQRMNLRHSVRWSIDISMRSPLLEGFLLPCIIGCLLQSPLMNEVLGPRVGSPIEGTDFLPGDHRRRGVGDVEDIGRKLCFACSRHRRPLR